MSTLQTWCVAVACQRERVVLRSKPSRALERDVIAWQRNLDLSTQRFQAGIDSYLKVLTAQTSLYGAQQALVSARMARLQTFVTLYKDLGGGWIAHTGDTPATPEDVGALAPHNNAPWDLLKSVRPAPAPAS